MTTEDQKVFMLAGFLSTLDEFKRQHPSDMVPIAKLILEIIRKVDEEQSE